MNKKLNIVGKKFNRLFVKSFSHVNNKGNTVWNCLCDCGKKIKVLGHRLTREHTKSCGCFKKDKLRNLNFKNLIGKQYGYLGIVGYEHRHVGKTLYIFWKCKCICEKIIFVRAGSLNGKITQSCGCMSDFIRKKTNMLLYGNECPIRLGEFQRKIEETNFKKYGTLRATQSKEVKDKFKKTCMERFGVENPQQNKDIQNKTKNTNLKKYGFENVSNCKDISVKQSRSQNNSCILIHWKTNEEIVCIGSYEKKVVEWLNENKIDYKWQSQIFETPFKTELGNAKTYRTDLFLIKDDKWVEIKGYFRKDAEEKWDWFHKTYLNSELWNKIKLKEKGIL